MKEVNPEELIGGDASDNAQLLTEILAGNDKGPRRDIVLLNAGAGLACAGLAKDLRVLVRERIKAGDSNDEVIAFIVDRYGDYVLLNPPVKKSTIVLWAGPGIVAILGLLALVLFFRKRRGMTIASAQAPLSAEERARLAKILDGDEK